MLLTPTEMERLTIFTAAEMARRRRARGVKLNHPEAVALICDEILERAREGATVAELMSYGSTILSSDDVMPGVVGLVPIVQVEAMFPDGTKLVTIHEPIRPGEADTGDTTLPGELVTADGTIELNAARDKVSLVVTNTGDRPVQIGRHYHFFETNRALDFDRKSAFGLHLDIPAGTAVRFEPGESREVTLVAFGGTGEIVGLNSLTDGSTRNDARRAEALRRARSRGFTGA